MEAHTVFESPRIASLRRTLTSTDNQDALETFWQEVVARGAPLIEVIEEDDKRASVTFVWRGDAETDRVVVWGGPAGLDHPEDHQMARLSGTNVWYKTYRIQTDLRGVYTFSINDP